LRRAGESVMPLEAWLTMADLAWLVWAIRLRRPAAIGASFPLVPGLLLGHLLLFGLPAVLYRDRLLEGLTPTSLRLAALTVSGAMAALLAGERLPLAAMLFPFCPRLRIAWRGNAVARLGMLVLIGLATMTVQKAGGPHWIFGAFTVGIDIGYVGLSGLWLMALRRELQGPMRHLLLLMATALMCGLELIQGELAGLLLIGLLLFACYLHVRRRIPWLLVAVALPLLLVLSGVKTALRAIAPDWNQVGLTQRVENYRLAGAAFWQNPAAYDVSQTLLARMSDINLLAVVIARSPDPVPYWDGATYTSLLWLPVPRLLAPAKPVLAADFGHRYGFVAPSDYVTAVNMPTLVELYANFGGWGAIAGMFCLGMVCQLFATLFADAQRSDATFAVAAALLVPFMMLVELPLVDTLGAFLQHLPLLLLFLVVTGVCRVNLGGPAVAAAMAAGSEDASVA